VSLAARKRTAIALGVLALLAFCYAASRTEDSVFGVTLHNDSMQIVVVQRQCVAGHADKPCDFAGTVQIPPDGTLAIAVSNGSGENIYRIVQQNGIPLGCFVFQFDHEVQGAVYQISQTTHCPANVPVR
jgi:hypothetical protein